MAIRDRTPLAALILAPFAPWALVLAWEHAVLPFSFSVWRGDVVEAMLKRGLTDSDRA
jgi:hypothetical protein